MGKRDGRRLPPVFGELRPSQIITTFGPGAVVDLPNVSVVIAGTDFWETSEEQEVDEPRLKSLLRVSKFYRPATRSDGGTAGIPAFLFPQYFAMSPLSAHRHCRPHRPVPTRWQAASLQGGA